MRPVAAPHGTSFQVLPTNDHDDVTEGSGEEQHRRLAAVCQLAPALLCIVFGLIVVMGVAGTSSFAEPQPLSREAAQPLMSLPSLQEPPVPTPLIPIRPAAATSLTISSLVPPPPPMPPSLPDCAWAAAGAIDLAAQQPPVLCGVFTGDAHRCNLAYMGHADGRVRRCTFRPPAKCVLGPVATCASPRPPSMPSPPSIPHPPCTPPYPPYVPPRVPPGVLLQVAAVPSPTVKPRYVLDALNARCASGRPSNHVAEAGVLLHMLDGGVNPSQPWIGREGRGFLSAR